MAKANNLQPLWDQLVGDDLSGITFVRDYLQLQFNSPPFINATSRKITVTREGRSANFGEDAFANLVIGLIGGVVSKVALEEAHAFEILFEGGAKIEISLRPEDYPKCGEALLFQGRERQWAVI